MCIRDRTKIEAGQESVVDLNRPADGWSIRRPGDGEVCGERPSLQTRSAGQPHACGRQQSYNLVDGQVRCRQLECQRCLWTTHRIGSVDMHGHAAGFDTKVVDLAGPGIQVVGNGVSNIDRVRGGRAIGHQLQPGRVHRPVAVQGLTLSLIHI